MIMETRNIVIAPCGNRSTVFNHYWLKDKENKNFDLCLLFYDKSVLHAHRYEQVDYFYHLQGFKYPMLYQLLTNIHPEWLNKYDYFYFLDDDIEVSTEDINRLFDASRLMDSWISCAALTQDSYCSWPIFKQQVHSFCRFVGQIEVMAPLFSRNALKNACPLSIKTSLAGEWIRYGQKYWVIPKTSLLCLIRLP